jgi:hypothetical protein
VTLFDGSCATQSGPPIVPHIASAVVPPLVLDKPSTVLRPFVFSDHLQRRDADAFAAEVDVLPPDFSWSMQGSGTNRRR